MSYGDVCGNIIRDVKTCVEQVGRRQGLHYLHTLKQCAWARLLQVAV